MEAVFQTPWGEGKCRTRLLGRFNAQNLAACVALLCANGYPLDKVLDVLAKIRPASGRMDCIMNSGKPLVVVDYAHTPDALEKALSTLQEIKPQGAALWCVFGCGGNRDRGKRPLMGAAAVQGADKVVVTSDTHAWKIRKTSSTIFCLPSLILNASKLIVPLPSVMRLSRLPRTTLF